MPFHHGLLGYADCIEAGVEEDVACGPVAGAIHAPVIAGVVCGYDLWDLRGDEKQAG